MNNENDIAAIAASINPDHDSGIPQYSDWALLPEYSADGDNTTTAVAAF